MKVNEYSSLTGVNSNTAGVGSAQEQKNDNQISFADQINLILQTALKQAAAQEETTGKLSKAADLADEFLTNNNLIYGVSNKVAMTAADGSDALLPPRQSLSALEDLLGVLEKYETALADPSVSLKNLHPLVLDMQQKAQRLQEALPRIESSLTPLANQIISQAQVESIKFQRGDYID